MNYLVLSVSHDGQKFIGIYTDGEVAISVCNNCRKDDEYEYCDVNVYEYELNSKFDIFKSNKIF